MGHSVQAWPEPTNFVCLVFGSYWDFCCWTVEVQSASFAVENTRWALVT